MIEITIDKKTGKQILLSKFLIIIPSILIGGFIGIYYYQLENSMDWGLIYKYVIPLTLIIALISAYIGSKIAVNKLINTKIQLTETELIKTFDSTKTVIRFSDVITIKETWTGLLIRDNKRKIHIPKQVINYSEFRDKIKEHKNRKTGKPVFN